MPAYALKEWNEDNSPMLVPYVREAYRHRLWSKVSNYVRLHALWTEGGVYLDTDVEVVKPLDPLLNQRMFLGFQVQDRRADWVDNAVAGAVAGHPLNRTCLDMTVAGLSAEGKFYLSPVIVTRALVGLGLKDYGLQRIGDVQLYPTPFFYPYSWEEDFQPGCLTADTYCIHHWSGSWKDAMRKYERYAPARDRWRRFLHLGRGR